MGNIRAPLTPITDEDLPDSVAGADTLKAGIITTDKLAAGAVTADKITLTIDDINDGETYGRIKKTSIDANGVVILDEVKDGDTYAKVKKAALTADGLILLDEVKDGDSYAKVKKTDIKAGHLYISNSNVFAAGYDPSTKARHNAVNTTIVGSYTPTSRPDGTDLQYGDVWFDSGNNDKMYVWTYSNNPPQYGYWAQQYTEIDGGHIVTGEIKDGLNRSRINLNDGTFNLGNGAVSWDGSILQVIGDIKTSDATTRQRIVLSSANGTLKMYDSSGNNILDIDTSDAMPFFNFAGNYGSGVTQLGRIHFDTNGKMYIQSTANNLLIDAGYNNLIKIGYFSDIVVDSKNSKVQIDNGIYINNGHLTSNGTHLYFTDSGGVEHTII